MPRICELLTHRMVARKSKCKKEPLVVRSFTITPSLDTTLQRLSHEAPDFTGWTVSTSAMIRVLLRHVEQQPSLRARSSLFPLIEQELSSGVVWRSKKK